MNSLKASSREVARSLGGSWANLHFAQHRVPAALKREMLRLEERPPASTAGSRPGEAWFVFSPQI